MTRLGGEDRRRTAGGFDLDRPSDLGVARLTKSDELFGGKASELDLLSPWLRHRAHDDLASGRLGELTPAERDHLVENRAPLGRSCGTTQEPPRYLPEREDHPDDVRIVGEPD
jgi:hypothetical protein